jgi:RNA polymerase sigma-70 factor (ECF subfamily)
MRNPLARGPAPSAAESGDFETLVGPWVEEMYRIAAAIVGSAEAGDVTQDALLDAWRGLARLRDRERVRPWLHAIVANRSLKQIRAWRSRPRTINVEPIGRPNEMVPDVAGVVLERERLDRAFDRLTAEQRVCLALRYSVDLTVPQIASTLAIPEGTVKSRLHSGLARMREALAEDDR